MKRLITMMTAAVLGFFAHADAGSLVEAKETFESGTIGEAFDLTAQVGGKTVWFNAGAENPTKVTTNETGKAELLGDKFVELETDGTLYRSLSDSYGKASADVLDTVPMGCYLDTYVRFTATEGPAAVEDNAQLGIWLQVDEIDENTSVTNLMVKCGAIDASYEAQPTNLALNVAIEAGSWHRLTVKTTTDTPEEEAVFGFFVVYIDGVAVSVKDYTGVFAEGVVGEIITKAENKQFIANKQLLPSLRNYNAEKTGLVTSLGFNGTGAIDNVSVTANNPLAVQYTAVAIAHATAVPASGEIAPGSKVTFTYTAETGYLFKNGTNTLVVEGTIGNDGKVTLPADTETTATKAGFAITVASTTNYYLTFETANAAVKSGETITLVENCTAAVVSTATVDFAFDLNEKTITSDAVATIKNDGAGTMTIKNGTVKNTANATDKGIAVWARSGSVVIESGSYENASEYEGTIYIGGNTADNKTITITGGTFKNTASRYAYRPAFSKGIVLNVYNTLANKETAFVITGGTYSMDPAGGDHSGIPPTFVANGYGSFAVDSYWVVAAYPKAVAAENALAAAAGELDVAYTFSAQGNVPGAPVATKNVDYYVTFDKAVAKGTITLKALMLNDQQQPVWVTFPMTEDIAAGVPYPLVAAMQKTVNVAEMYALGSFTCGVKNNAVANNGTKMTVQLAMSDVPLYEIAKVDYTLNKEAGFAVIIADGSVTNYYDTLKAAFAAAKAGDTVALFADSNVAGENTSDADITFDLNGFTLTSDATATIKHNGTGTLTIKNGTVKNTANAVDQGIAVWARSGSVVIESGYFQNQSEYEATIYIGGRTADNKQITINGGTFKNAATRYHWRSDWNKGIVLNAYNTMEGKETAIVVNGGSYSMTPECGDDSNVPPTFLASNKATTYADGLYTVVAAVAKIGDKGYATFADAFAAVADGGTVVVVADYTGLVEVPEGNTKNITFDLNGKTITAATTATIKHNGTGKLTITGNGSVYNTANAVDMGIAVWARSGSVVIENGYFQNQSEYEATVYIGAATANGKTFTINGGTFKNTATRYEYRPTYTQGIVLNVWNSLSNKESAFVISAGDFSSTPENGDDAGIPPTFLAGDYKATWNPSTGYYTVAQRQYFDVAVANVGEKATLVVNQSGAVEQGTTITGTLSDLDANYNAYVYVDGVKVDVVAGAFSGTANNSAKVVVSYVKKDAWYLDPFLRNEVHLEGDGYSPVGHAYDGTYAFHGKDPGDGSSKIAMLKVADFIESIDPKYPTEQSGLPQIGGKTPSPRQITVSAEYGVLLYGQYSDCGGIVARKYSAAGLSQDYYLIPTPSEGKLSPLAMGKDSANLYGVVNEGGIVYKYAVEASEGVITGLTKTKQYNVCGALYTIMSYTVGDRDLIYCSDDAGKKIYVIDTQDDSVTTNAVTSGRVFAANLTGTASGTPHLICADKGGNVCVYALSADCKTVLAEAPMYSYTRAQMGAGSGNYASGFATDDEKNFIHFVQSSTGGTGISEIVTEQKPAQLIVRGTFSDEENAEDDVLVNFGEAADVKFDAPEGKSITAVTVNGVAVSPWEAADSYTFTSAALTTHAFVKMTTIDKTFTVTFLNEDSSVYAISNNVPYNTAFADVKPADPSKTGYDFAGWVPAGEAVTSNATYTASFTEIAVESVTLDADAIALTVGDAATNVTATINPSTALVKTVTWDWSAIANYAEVAENGNVITITATNAQAVASAPLTVTATAGAKNASFTITISAKASAPVVDDKDAEVKKDDTAGGNSYTIDTEKTALNVQSLGDATAITIPANVATLSGVDPSKTTIKVTSTTLVDTYDITGACKLTDNGSGGYTVELDSSKSVQVTTDDGTETIKVQPELDTDDEENPPLVIAGGEITLNVKTIPGLTYQLVKSTSLGASAEWVAVGEPMTADEARTGVKAAQQSDPSAFYKVRVTK